MQWLILMVALIVARDFCGWKCNIEIFPLPCFVLLRWLISFPFNFGNCFPDFLFVLLFRVLIKKKKLSFCMFFFVLFLIASYISFHSLFLPKHFFPTCVINLLLCLHIGFCFVFERNRREEKQRLKSSNCLDEFLVLPVIYSCCFFTLNFFVKSR